MKPKIVGVVGAGVMGTGVAQSLAQGGHTVLLMDVSDDALRVARLQIEKGLRAQRLFRKAIESDPAAVLGSIIETREYSRLAAAEFVIENVPERWATKCEVYAELDRICAPECIFAVNTSAVPISRIAELTRRAQQVVGVHFMNPVPLKPVVEVVRGRETSEATLSATAQLLSSMGKQAIVVNDSPGFVVNRVLMLAINEAACLVAEGVASVSDIDRAFKQCLDHKMGPLETADLIGIDTIVLTLEVLSDALRDSKFRPSTLLCEMVASGAHGRKAGRGFYSYEANE